MKEIFNATIVIVLLFFLLIGIVPTEVKADTVNPPSPFIGEQAATTIWLSWIKGSGSTTTYIRYSTGAYPATIGDGTLATNTTGASVTLSGLIPGTTYYFRAWGWSAIDGYSGSTTTLMITSSAGISTPTVPALNYTSPSNMYQNTTATGFATNPLAGIVENVADAYEAPGTTVWIFLALLLCLAAGIWVYSASSNVFLLLIAIGAGIGFAISMGLLPLWILVVYIILGIAVIMVSSRYGA
jgi:hypothetical protein